MNFLKSTLIVGSCMGILFISALGCSDSRDDARLTDESHLASNEARSITKSEPLISPLTGVGTRIIYIGGTQALRPAERVEIDISNFTTPTFLFISTYDPMTIAIKGMSAHLRGVAFSNYRTDFSLTKIVAPPNTPTFYLSDFSYASSETSDSGDAMGQVYADINRMTGRYPDSFIVNGTVPVNIVIPN